MPKPKTNPPARFAVERMKACAELRHQAVATNMRTALIEKRKFTRQQMCDLLGISQPTSYEPQWAKHFKFMIERGVIYRPTQSRWRAKI